MAPPPLFLAGWGTTTYQWQISANGTIWSNISGATAFTYTTSSLDFLLYLLQRSIVHPASVTASIFSLITVVADPGISVTGEVLVYVMELRLPLGSGITGGTGTPSHQWQSSINNSTWTNITEPLLPTIQRPAMTAARYYRVALTGEWCRLRCCQLNRCSGHGQSHTRHCHPGRDHHLFWRFN